MIIDETIRLLESQIVEANKLLSDKRVRQTDKGKWRADSRVQATSESGG